MVSGFLNYFFASYKPERRTCDKEEQIPEAIETIHAFRGFKVHNNSDTAHILATDPPNSKIPVR